MLRVYFEINSQNFFSINEWHQEESSVSFGISVWKEIKKNSVNAYIAGEGSIMHDVTFITNSPQKALQVVQQVN